MEPALSVIIPHHDRLSALMETLGALARQTLSPDAFEVIVVDDGSPSAACEAVRAASHPFTLSALRQPHLGPAAARNLGARSARGDVLLFLDCDILLEPEALRCHLKSHGSQPPRLAAGAVVARANAVDPLWSRLIDEPLGDTRASAARWDDLLGALTVPFYDSWAGNLSVPCAVFLSLRGFDEKLQAFEDVEFAWRAAREGMPIAYLPGALGRHDHPRTLAERFRQAESYKSYLPALCALHPELRSAIRPLAIHEPIAWRSDRRRLILAKLAVRVLARPGVLDFSIRLLELLAAMHALPRILTAVYWRILRAHEYRGVRLGRQQLSRPRPTRDVSAWHG
jgi:GT2 family glycosyltransferase